MEQIPSWETGGSLTYLLSYSLEQSPFWEANRFSASQEIPRDLWNLKVHYRNHMSPSPVPILSQIDPVHATSSRFLKIQLNIIFPSTLVSTKWSFSLRFPHQNTVNTSLLLHKCYMPSPFHSSGPAFLKLWSADHKWSSGSALVVLLDWTLVQKRQKK